MFRGELGTSSIYTPGYVYVGILIYLVFLSLYFTIIYLIAVLTAVSTAIHGGEAAVNTRLSGLAGILKDNENLINHRTSTQIQLQPVS
jgi:uncharacterized protein YoxC